MKRIEMATNLSAHSDRALDRAVMLACEHGAELTVVPMIAEDLLRNPPIEVLAVKAW